jgi:hypothetical protein
MTTINVPIGPPYGTIPVNISVICAAIPDPASPAAASDLLIDSAGGRSINALVEIAEIGRMLGIDFVEFTAADQARSTCFVHQKTWVSIVPHPQIDAVSQINFANRRPLAVVGTVKDVLARLERGPAAKSAKRAPAR